MHRGEPELIIDPGREAPRPEGKFAQVLRVALTIGLLAAIIGGGLLLLAGLFTLLAFIVPAVLLVGLIYVLLNRRRISTIVIRRR